MKYQFIRFPGGRAKAVSFSYDDGCREDIRLSDLFTQYGLKATFNLNSEAVRRALTKEDVEEHILAPGHEVAIHGEYHSAQTLVRVTAGLRDAYECRRELEEKYGRIIRGMAYPDSGISTSENGTTYARVKSYLTDLGIAYARALGLPPREKYRLPTDWHAWIPTAHHDDKNIMAIIDDFLNTKVDISTMKPKQMHARLLYIWGHSYEFQHKNNWEHIEEICQKLSGKEEIWYATNIEIYEYVKAYESLVYSLDGNTVYNPTATKIWFVMDAVPYEVEPGQTICLKK